MFLIGINEKLYYFLDMTIITTALLFPAISLIILFYEVTISTKALKIQLEGLERDSL